MFTANYSCYILKKKHSTVFGVLLSVAIIAGVFYAVGLYAGEKAPKGLPEIMPYILIISLLFTAEGIFYYYTKRFKVLVIGENERLTIEIKDPSLTAPLVITSPINISTQWMEQLMGKGPKMKSLFLTICDKNNTPLVTFEGVLGSAYSAPKHFEYLNILDTEQRKKLIIAPLQYSNSKVRELTDEIRIYLNYLEKKKEKTAGPPQA